MKKIKALSILRPSFPLILIDSREGDYTLLFFQFENELKINYIYYFELFSLHILLPRNCIYSYANIYHVSTYYKLCPLGFQLEPVRFRILF